MLVSIYEEIGLPTLLGAPRDVYLLVALRMVRLFAFGSASLILALYLEELGFGASEIGFFMSVTFVGDLASSFVLSIITSKFGRRNILVVSTVLMTLTGLGFCIVTHPLILSAIAAIGIMTPSGVEVGPFRSIEQSSIASLVRKEERSDIYAWYTFLGFFCSAIGSAITGVFIDLLQNHAQYTLLQSYKAVFAGYAALSALTIPIALFITHEIEGDCKQENSKPSSGGGPDAQHGENDENETSLLLGEESNDNNPDETSSGNVSTASIILQISILFGLDAFASSLVPFSWQTYYISNKFRVSSSVLGTVFFITGILSGFGSLISTSFTKRLGAVLTMVATHLPASTLLIFIPYPSSFIVTLVIMALRSSTQSMDVVPKHVFLAALVPDSQRTAVFAWINVVKTSAQLLGPPCTGFLVQHKMQWSSFVIAGLCKVTYDLGIVFAFWTSNRHELH